MSKYAAIDCYRFALERQLLEGRLAISSFERLFDQLSDREGEVAFSLEGKLSDRGRVGFRLRVTGVVSLVCQRCLDKLSHQVDIDNRLEMSPDMSELTQEELEDVGTDYLPLEKTLDVSDLVEEELILSLPVAPRHDECSLQHQKASGGQVLSFPRLSGLKHSELS